MPQTHFRCRKATQNKSNVTNRFGDRDLVLAVCMCFIHKGNRFEVTRDFRSNHGGNPFPVHRDIAEQKWRHQSIRRPRLYVNSVHVLSVIPIVSKLFVNFVRQIMAEVNFRSMEASQNESDVTIQVLVGGLVIHCGNFPSILFR
jgi:hypothetical protein